MPSDKTVVTELATGLGMAGLQSLEEVLEARPAMFVNLAPADWGRLTGLFEEGRLGPEFMESFLNGQAFLRADQALRGRVPWSVEWTGGRRPPGDEVVPADLRVDHVYLVSCKYLSRILHNPSPARLVTGLLSQEPVADLTDWFQRVAPEEHQALYACCRAGLGDWSLPGEVSGLAKAERRRLASSLRAGWPPGAGEAYAALCEVVARRTAEAWRRQLDPRKAEAMLWRLLRIGSTPYFVLGTSDHGTTRLRIDTPWDWRQRYALERFVIGPKPGGQAIVGWTAHYADRATGETGAVEGHVEIRWSHGRFGQPPEAKVYLDSPIASVPGYHPI